MKTTWETEETWVESPFEIEGLDPGDAHAVSGTMDFVIGVRSLDNEVPAPAGARRHVTWLRIKELRL